MSICEFDYSTDCGADAVNSVTAHYTLFPPETYRICAGHTRTIVAAGERYNVAVSIVPLVVPSD